MTAISTATTVGELVVDDPARARIFEQLGLDYCCGGKRPLAEACRERGLDPDTVVAMLNAAAAGGGGTGEDWSRAPLAELCDHIVEAHHGFLRRELPRLSTLVEKVERAHAAQSPALHEVRTVFEELRAELESHTEVEERVVFPACRDLDAGAGGDEELATRFATLESEHEAAGAHLERLSELTGHFDVAQAFCNTHRAALDALRELELDLHEHIHEENNILFPRALAAATR
ncbi:MAG: iron-sulfur cluster repair di-iron protein [Gaiellaceae bacterium]